ncbi:MAG: hypothetical protein ILO43_04520 [Clostridia bacterium]|nr:hypothetical protein [Clostridia bacterium]
MDEFNLASRFAQDDEEDQRPNRRRKKPRFRTGVGMEKPVEETDILDDIGGIETEPGEKSPAEIPPMDELGEEEPEEGEDEAFDALVSRLEGESASSGRAKKRRALVKKAKPGNDSLRKEFADRM